jgi:hypothetical protein
MLKLCLRAAIPELMQKLISTRPMLTVPNQMSAPALSTDENELVDDVQHLLLHLWCPTTLRR